MREATYGAGGAEEKRLDDLLVEGLRTTTTVKVGQLQLSRACRLERDDRRRRGRERERTRRTVPRGVRPEKRTCETSCCAAASLVMLCPTTVLFMKKTCTKVELRQPVCAR